MPTTEPTINDALANLLRKTRRAWSGRNVVRGESTGSFQGNSAKPDILVVEPDVPPFIIETEVVPAVTVEKEAKSRLGQKLRSSTYAIHSALAVRLPARLRDRAGDELTDDLRSADDFEYALFQGDSPDSFHRWPTRGWLRGGIEQLSSVAQYAAIPPKLIAETSARFVGGIDAAAGRLGEIATRAPGAMTQICTILHQQDSVQTRGMAMTIVANAFIFHESLAGRPGRLSDIRPVAAIRNGSGRLAKTKVIAEWQRILEINYWPIFDVAKRIVTELPTDGATEILDLLEQRTVRSASNYAAIADARRWMASRLTTAA